MGGYQLSLHGGSYNPAARLEENQKSSSAYGSSRGKKSSKHSPGHGYGFFQAKRVASQQNLEGLMQASPPRHSTACCDGLSERREVERRLSSQRTRVGAPVRDSEDCNGDSFRSEDSESLALWEEKEPASTDHGWMKLTTQSPRWLEAMRKFGRSSPVHPKSSRDTPRASLDRKPSTRSLHDSSKSWYSNATKKIRSGESRSVRSPKGASNLVRQSGELCPALVSLSKWDHDGVTSGDSKDGSFSRLTEEDTRFTASAVAWDISSRPELVVEKARVVNGLAWEIPSNGAPEMAVSEDAVDANSLVTKGAHSVTDKPAVLNASGDLSNVSNEEWSESFFDGQSEYASCRTFAEDELTESESRLCNDKKSTTEDSAEFVNVIDFVAPLFTKLQSMEKEDDASAIARTKSCERRVQFKWEAPQGKQLRADEVAPATETPQPQPFATKDGISSSYETLRQQYMTKSQSAPLDGLYVIDRRPPGAPKSSIAETYVAADSFLTKSRSSNDAEGPLRRAYDSPDHKLFTKLRKSVFGTTRGPSPQGAKNDLGDFIESSSPRSILRGPDDGSVPSSNPSLRSDPGTPAFSAIPTSSASQSISSCSASFDLDLNEGDYEMRYDLNSTAACIIVESRRVSLSFRDFGPARPSGEDMAGTEDGSENATSNIELLSCDDQLDTNALRSLPETMESPELWTATFSTRFQVCESPLSDIPDSLCAATERESEFPAEFASPAPVSRRTYVVRSEGEQQQVPIVIQKSRSRNGEFTARLGVMFSPLRLISSHESNHSCFVAATLSPPHEDGGEGRSPTYAATLELLPPAELHSSSTTGRKAKSSWTNGEKVKSRSSTRRHSSDDAQTMMVSISKAMKKFLSKCTVKRSTSKGKSKLGSPVLDALPPAEFHFTEAN